MVLKAGRGTERNLWPQGLLDKKLGALNRENRSR